MIADEQPNLVLRACFRDIFLDNCPLDLEVAFEEEMPSIYFTIKCFSRKIASVTSVGGLQPRTAGRPKMISMATRMGINSVMPRA
jgi:hypothetical protein